MIDPPTKRDPLGILGDSTKKKADPLGILKKKEPSGSVSPTGGEAGISEARLAKGITEGVLKAVKPKKEKAVSGVFGPYGLTQPSEAKIPKEKPLMQLEAGRGVPKYGHMEGDEETMGFFNAIDRGIKQGELADMMALGQTPRREDLKEIARLNREIANLPSSAAYERFNNAPSFGDAISEFVDNPFEITSQLVAESLSALVRHGYSRVGAGMVTGGTAGSVVPGIGTVAGMSTGMVAGMGLTSYNLEMASSMMDAFREAGVDVTDEKSLTDAFDNPETLRKARDFAQKRAVPIALFDMFSAGMGGKLLGKPAKTMLAKVGRVGAEVGVQSAMAGAGETTAQLVAGQKFNPTAVFSEMIGEVGGGAPDIVVGTMIEKAKRNQPVGSEAIKLNVKPEVLQDMLDISEASGEITEAQANQIKKQYEEIQAVRQSVPEEFKQNAEVIESLQQKRALEEAKKGLDPVFAKKIDEQIKALDTKIDNAISQVPEKVAPEPTPQVPAAPKEKYRVEYFDPVKGEMTHSYFDTRLEGDTFWGTLTDAQKSKGVKGYFEFTTEPSFGEEAAPQVPATQIAQNFKKDFNEGKLQKGEYGGGRNLGVYDYEGNIVKVVKEKRGLGENQITLMRERLGDMDNVYIPKQEIDLGEGRLGIVMDKATGIDASKLTKEQIDTIPQEHWDKFEADIRELSKRGVAVDLTKRDNFFYDKDKGFSFIDISGISMDGEPTTKFFMKDGVEFYYPLEQYPFSKKFEGGKKIFENIAEIKKMEEEAPQVPAAGKIKSSWETNIESLINPETGLSAVLRKIANEQKPFKEEFLKRKGLTFEDYNNLSEDQKNAIQEEWIKSEEFKKLQKETEAPQVPEAPITEEEIKTKRYAISEPSPEGVLQREQEGIREEGGRRRGVESPVERLAAAQESKVENAKKEIERREKAYAPPEGKQLEVNNLLNELYKFNNQKRGRLGLKTIESLKKRNELLIEAKRLGFETKVDKEGRITVKRARAIDKSNSNMAIDSKFVPLEKRSEKLRNLYNKIQGLSQRYGWDFQTYMPNVIVGADGKKMNNKQIANALKDLNDGIPSKGANLILNDLEAMAESGYVEIRDGQNVIAVPIDEYFNEMEKMALGDADRVSEEDVASLPEADLVKWLEEMQAEQQFESEIYEPSTEEALPEGRVEPETKKEVSRPVRPAAAKPTGEAGRGAPPTEGGKKLAAAEEEPKRLSGIKKALVSREVLDKVDLERTGDKQLLAAGKQIIESGEVNPKPLIDKIVDEGKGVLTPAEVVALITYKADLDTKVENLRAEIERMEAAGEDIGTRGVELKSLELDQQNFDIAAVITAQQQSMSFRLRMWMLDSGYNLQKEISQYKKINNGVIPEDVKKKFEEYDAEIQRLKKKIKDVNAQRVDEEGEQAAANIVEDVQREGKLLSEEEVEAKVKEGVQKEVNKIYEQLPAKKKSKADQAIAALERIQKRLRNKTYDAGLGIPVAIIDAGITTIKNAIKAGVAIERAVELGINKIKDSLKGKPFANEDKFRKDLLDGFAAEGIKEEKEVKESPSINEDGTLNIPEKFLRNLVRDGVTTIEGMTDAVFNELQPQLPELTKRQVRDAITQYGKTVNPTKDDIRQQIGQAKRLGRLISELEDIKNMNSLEFALKYGRKKPKGVKVSEQEKNLKAEIKTIAKSLKTNEQNLTEAKEAAKKRIEELQRRIREKDFSKKEKPVLKSDAELEMLYADKKELENKFEEEKERARLKNRPATEKARDVFVEITTGIPRILVAGFDLSATLVQLVRTLFTKPKIAAEGFIEGLRQFGSIERNEKFLKRYRSSYNGIVAKNSGLAISDVDGKISAKDQIFVIKWANAIYDAVARVVTFGHKPSAQFIQNINPLKASQRAYDGAVNYVRTRSFDIMMKSLQNDGYTPESNPEQFKSAADFVNTTTGRASLGKLEGSAKWLSTVLFSPRKLASEFKLYSPYAILYYGKMPSAVRKRAMADFVKFTGSVLVTHLLLRASLEALGEKQDDDFWDADSSNFLSFKIGDKRVSVLGGAKSMLVFMSRFLFGDRYVDQYGVESKFGERPTKRVNTKKDLVTEFFYGKFAPGVGALRDYYDQNPNYEDDEKILKDLVIPLWLQDANELYKDDPVSVTLMFNFLSIIGANIRKVDVSEVRDKIIFKEKVGEKEVKRIVELTSEQKEEFQNIVNTKLEIQLRRLKREIDDAKSGPERAKYIKMAADKAKKDAQEILERRYRAQFKQFPIEGEEDEDKIMERVKKKLQ
jgi:hypothetical protein